MLTGMLPQILFAYVSHHERLHNLMVYLLTMSTAYPPDPDDLPNQPGPLPSLTLPVIKPDVETPPTDCSIETS